MASKRDEVSATYSATSQGLDTSRTFGRQGKKGLRGLRAPISAAAKAKGVQLIDEFRAEAVDLEMPRPQLVARARTKLRAAAARKGQLGRWARDRLGAIDVAEAGLKRDFDVLKPEPALALPPEAQHDFTTLIRDEPVGTRTPLLMAPRSKPYEPGTFADAPQLTPYVPIIWDIYGGGGGAVQHFNVRVDERSIMRGSERPPPHIRGEKGILLLDANGVLISARFPRFGGAALPPLEQREGKAISQEAARLRNPTSRGDEKAGCARHTCPHHHHHHHHRPILLAHLRYGILFAVTSDKRGQDEQIVMPMCDAQLSAHDEHAWVQLYKRQRYGACHPPPCTPIPPTLPLPAHAGQSERRASSVNQCSPSAQHSVPDTCIARGTAPLGSARVPHQMLWHTSEPSYPPTDLALTLSRSERGTSPPCIPNL